MPDEKKLLTIAADCYKAWLNTGKDYLNHQLTFQVWDEAIELYMKATRRSRASAIVAVQIELGMLTSFGSGREI